MEDEEWEDVLVGPDGVLMKADMTLVKQSSTAGHLSPQPNQFLNELMQGLDRINMEDAVDVNEEIPKVPVYDERQQRDFIRIKRLHPMSSVDIICYKDIE